MKQTILIILFLLSVVFLFGDGVQPIGSGTEADPYQVEILDNLLWISTNEISWDKHFFQIDDIDATDTQNWNYGDGFFPIGNFSNQEAFTGIYNGNSHSIENLYINSSDNHQGLFGFTNSSTLSNINILSANITGNDYTGGLIGLSDFSTTINNCIVIGLITGSDNVGGLIGSISYGTITESYTGGAVIGHVNIGGLVGYNTDESTIDNCQSTCLINASNYQAGGLVGWNRMDSVIQSSYATGSVIADNNLGGLVGVNSNNSIISKCFASGNVSGDNEIGGLVGSNFDGTIISNCFSRGNVIGNVEIGGLIGENAYATFVENCYSYGNVVGSTDVGGLAGINFGEIITSYWNIETSGQTYSAGGEGRTTYEMTYPYLSNTYVNWNFQSIWYEDEYYIYNDGYPFLYEFAVNINEYTINYNDDDICTNYPNPFNPTTTISFSIPEESEVDISIYNIKGQKVKQLVSDQLSTGQHAIIWNGDDDSCKPIGSGVYLYKLNVNGKTKAIKKCLLLK